MISSSNKVLFIGAGKWSHKIARLLECQNPERITKILSARNFVTSDNYGLLKSESLEDFGIIWVATHPSLQINVLTELQNNSFKVILEKPIAQSLKELDELRELIDCQKSLIFLSEPWTFSELWRNATNAILGYQGLVDIEAIRGGELIRNEFSASIDWIPHDFYLMSRLTTSLNLQNNEIKLRSANCNSNTIFLKYSIGNGREIGIEAGEFESRKAIWRVFVNGSLEIEINFDKKQLTRKIFDKNVIEDYSIDNPILTMLGVYESSTPMVNWDLILRLYKDAIITENSFD